MLCPQIAEAKEATQFSSAYKEAKRCRAYDAYQLLAASVTFGSHMEPLLALVRNRLAGAGSPAVRTKLAQLLVSAARGVANNPRWVVGCVRMLLLGAVHAFVCCWWRWERGVGDLSMPDVVLL